MSCIFDPGHEWTLELSLSQNILVAIDSTFWISDAHVVLLDEYANEFYQFEHLEKGIYKIQDVFPKPGTFYSIEIEHPIYGSVKARSVVPDPFIVEDLTIIDVSDDLTEKIKISALIKFFNSSINGIIVENRLEKYYLTQTGDTVVVNESDLLKHLDEALYKDVFLSDNTITSRLFFDQLDLVNHLELLSFNGLKKNEDNNLFLGKAQLEFTAASNDYYRYLKSIELYKENNGKLLTGILSPIELYSNIEGGLGIFAGKYVFSHYYEF